MGKTKKLFGVVPIVPTPFTDNEEIDERALGDLIEFAIASGIQSVAFPRMQVNSINYLTKKN